MKSLYTGLLCLLSTFIFAQSETNDATINSEPKKNSLLVSVNYQNNLHFFGRTDSLQSSGLFPILNYQFKNGLYAQSNFIFTSNTAQPLNYGGSVLEVGYKLNDEKKLTGNFYYNQFLYSNTELVQASLTAQVGSNLSFKTKPVNINLNSSLMFSDKVDLSLSAGFDKLLIYRFSKFAIAINPTVLVNAGTQQFYNTYVKRTTLLGFPTNTMVKEEVKDFKVLSYDFSIPIVFVKGKTFVAVTPAYVIPQNLLPNELGNNLFTLLFTVGLKF